MQMLLHGRHKGSPTPPPISDSNQEEDNCSEGDSEGEDHSYLPHEVFALTWHADIGISCIWCLALLTVYIKDVICLV